MRIELGRAAGDVERGDAPALEEMRARVSATAPLISSVRFGPALTWQCKQDWLQR